MCVKDKIIILPFSVLRFFLPFLQISRQPNTTTHKISQFRKKKIIIIAESRRTLLCLAKIKFIEQWLKALQTKVMVLSFKSWTPLMVLRTSACSHAGWLPCPAPASTAHKPCLSGGSMTSSSRSIIPLLVQSNTLSYIYLTTCTMYT